MIEKNYLYQEEENKLFSFIMEKRFFEPWRDPLKYSDLHKESELELYITSKCNLKCEYCYLNRYQEYLYPQDKDDPKEILKNLSIFLQYCLDEGFHLPTISCFSGEIWHTDLGLDVLDIIYNFIVMGLKIQDIVIPTNGTFAKSQQNIDNLQSRIDKFLSVDVRLIFSLSIDGLPIENSVRAPKGSLIRDLSFYHNLFGFAAKNQFGFHPMVSAHGIEKWIETYEWFKSELKQFSLDFPFCAMLLEVRNNDWTEEKIQYYSQFIEHCFLDLYNSVETIEEKIEMITGIPINDSRELLSRRGYCNIRLVPQKYEQTCAISRSLTVRLGDLMINPCHRLAYPQLNYGQFDVQNDKIVGLIGNNPHLATKILLGNACVVFDKCDTCIYSKFCLRPCLGESFEDSGDLSLVDPIVCNFLKEKINILIDLYERYGLLQAMSKISPHNVGYYQIQQILTTVDGINKERKKSIYETAKS